MLDDLFVDVPAELLEAETRAPVGRISVGRIKKAGQTGRCQHHTGEGKIYCHVPTVWRFDGIPYCAIHCADRLDKIVGSLSKQLESLNIQPDMSWCCGDPEDCDENCNGRKG